MAGPNGVNLFANTAGLDPLQLGRAADGGTQKFVSSLTGKEAVVKGSFAQLSQYYAQGASLTDVVAGRGSQVRNSQNS